MYHGSKNIPELDRICAEEEDDDDGLLIYKPSLWDEVWLSEGEQCKRYTKLNKQRQQNGKNVSMSLQERRRLG